MKENVAQYRRTEILGQSQLDLIIQVYDKAIASMREASEHFRQDRACPGREALQKAGKCVTHLYTTLNHEKGGEVADQLGKLYAFVINEINVAESTKDLARIDSNITVLNNLRLGWLGLREQAVDNEKASGEQPAADSRSFATSA